MKTLEYKRILFLLLMATVPLLIPYFAMFFSDEVNWSLGDFAIAGILLMTTGALVELIFRKIRHKKSRFALIFAMLMILMLIWAELAVGLFNSPFAGS